VGDEQLLLPHQLSNDPQASTEFNRSIADWHDKHAHSTVYTTDTLLSLSFAGNVTESYIP
jgi:hypothetical protein